MQNSLGLNCEFCGNLVPISRGRTNWNKMFPILLRNSLILNERICKLS